MAESKPAFAAGTDPVMRLSRAFMESRVLLTAAELDVFTELSRQPRTATELAEARGWQLRPLTLVLDALVSLEMLVKQDGIYRCEPAVVETLSSNSPTSVLATVRHSAALWERWSALTARVTGRASGSGPDDLRAFIDAMHAIARPLAPRMVAAVRPAGAKRLLDLGGASGTYTMAFLEAVPGLHVTLLDRPEVIPLARERLTAGGWLDRVTLVPGDYLADPLPGGHDFAWLSAVIHSNGPEENLALYRRVFDALVPGGRLVIRDHVMSEDHTAPRAGTLFAINMLGATRSGRTYSYREIAGALEEANFAGVRLLQGGEVMDALVEARRPA
jgi:predicted O-methyltransferase YrrM